MVKKPVSSVKYTKNFAAEMKNLKDSEILFEIGSIGAGHASTALSDILHENVEIDVPRLHLISPHLVPEIYKKHDTTIATIFMQLSGSFDCDLMLIFDEEEASKIAKLLTKDAESKAGLSMKRSAIEELGSIMICSFISTIANFTQTELIPNPPQLIIDDFDAIIDGPLAKQALSSNTIAIFDARFRRYNSSAEGFLIIFLDAELQTLLANKGKKWLNVKTAKEKITNLPLLQ